MGITADPSRLLLTWRWPLIALMSGLLPTAPQEGASRSLELLPSGALYPLYRAGTAEPRISGTLLFVRRGGSYFDAALGGRDSDRSLTPAAISGASVGPGVRVGCRARPFRFDCFM